jgi:TRAP transporter TAXI family solute receptor
MEKGRHFVRNLGFFSSLLILVMFTVLFDAPTTNAWSPPKVLTIACYDIGSSAYIQGSAIAEAIYKKYNVKVRLIPISSDVARMEAVRSGKADFELTGGGTWTATQGLYEFSSITWGPQQLRYVWRSATQVGAVATKASGIKTPYDLKGKRVCWYPGTPGNQISVTATLAFGNLTWDDVQKVEVPSYSAGIEALISGKSDVASSSATSSQVQNLATSPMGAHFLSCPPNDKAGWERFNKVCPYGGPIEITVGVGSEESPRPYVMTYGYPDLNCYPNTDPNLVYWLVKAIHELYPMYSPHQAAMQFWDLKWQYTPFMCPIHPSVIRYFKDINYWKPQFESWNKKVMAEEEMLLKAWDTTLKIATENKVKERDFPKLWIQERSKIPGLTPPVYEMK